MTTQESLFYLHKGQRARFFVRMEERQMGLQASQGKLYSCEIYNLFLKHPEENAFRMELTNVPEDIKALFDAVSRTQVRAKVIPSQTTEVSFKGTPQQMLNALDPNWVMPIHCHRNSSETLTDFF